MKTLITRNHQGEIIKTEKITWYGLYQYLISIGRTKNPSKKREPGSIIKTKAGYVYAILAFGNRFDKSKNK